MSPYRCKVDVRVRQFVCRDSQKGKRTPGPQVHSHHGNLFRAEESLVRPRDDRPGIARVHTGLAVSIDPQFIIPEIEDQLKGPGREYARAHMGVRMTIVEPASLDEIREGFSASLTLRKSPLGYPWPIVSSAWLELTRRLLFALQSLHRITAEHSRGWDKNCKETN